MVAAISLVLGLYMTSRDDGITLLSTLVNFGALTAFLLLHVSVVVHFVVRQKSRDWWRHLVVPVIGFVILLYVHHQREGRRPAPRLHLAGDRPGAAGASCWPPAASRELKAEEGL